MPLRRTIALGGIITAFAASTALSCPDDTRATASALTNGPQPHPRAAEIVAYRPHAWRPVSFGVAAPGAAGMVLSIDPVDGAMGVPAQGSLGSSLLVTPVQDLRPVSLLRRADGSVRAQLDERWEEHAVATFGPDGKPHWTCVEGTRGAAEFMNHPVVPVIVVPEVK
jgi:hypothetical protein